MKEEQEKEYCYRCGDKLVERTGENFDPTRRSKSFPRFVRNRGGGEASCE